MIRVIHGDDESSVYLDNFLVASFCCGHMALALERRFELVMTEPTKEMAIHSLIATLGCCEDTADLLYSKLEQRGTLQ